jgi:hypothetical protein
MFEVKAAFVRLIDNCQSRFYRGADAILRHTQEAGEETHDD